MRNYFRYAFKVFNRIVRTNRQNYINVEIKWFAYLLAIEEKWDRAGHVASSHSNLARIVLTVHGQFGLESGIYRIAHRLHLPWTPLQRVHLFPWRVRALVQRACKIPRCIQQMQSTHAVSLMSRKSRRSARLAKVLSVESYNDRWESADIPISPYASRRVVLFLHACDTSDQIRDWIMIYIR